MTDIATIEDIIEEARNGRPYILVDAEDRENEGDVIIPAQFATPDQVNFMARNARGLICLALTKARADELDLMPMARHNQSQHETAFTISIEAREGVTTGISAADRSHSIATAIDPKQGRYDVVSPGHVFPLVARDGGTLVRAGHTEAAVDISRLAGLNPAGVICEIMNEDGTMARLPELKVFAREHGLKIGTIADLITFRRRKETLVERVASAPFESHYGGNFQLHVYRNKVDQAEHVALVRGEPTRGQPTLVRVHQVDIMSDILAWQGGRRDYVGTALRHLADHDGPAVAVFVRDANPASVSDKVRSRGEYFQKKGLIDIGVGAQILRDIGVGKMILLSSSQMKLDALGGFGLEVIDRVPMRAEDEKNIRLVK